MAAAPVAPESQGYSPNATPGVSVPTAAPSPTPDPLSAPIPANFGKVAAGSASSAIDGFKKGVLQATAEGGMAQQKEFVASHDAAVAARTGALQRAQQVATATGGDPRVLAALNARIDPGMGIRIGNMDMHQADFKSAAKQREMSYTDYMNEVQSAIPLAQAAAQAKMSAKLQATKAASLQNQYDTAVGVAGQQQSSDQAIYDKAQTDAAPKLSAINQKIANLTLQAQTNDQLLGEMAGAKKAGITGSGSQGMKLGGAMTSGATYDQNRYQKLSDSNMKLKNMIAEAQAERDQIGTGMPGQPKGINEYVKGLVGSGSPALQGKATLSEPSLVGGQQKLAKSLSPSEVSQIMGWTGLKIEDAKAIASSDDYSSGKGAADGFLKVATDARGAIVNGQPGAGMSPWDAFEALVQGADANTKTALIKQYEPMFRAASRMKVSTLSASEKRQKAAKHL